jgi:hypothetical protein
MENRHDGNDLVIAFIRLAARILSILVIGIELLLIFGEGIHPSTTMDWIGLLFFPVGISAGMILAWWKEGLGGIITVGSLVAFYMIHYATLQTLPNGAGWFSLSSPGFLFLIHWYITRETK